MVALSGATASCVIFGDSRPIVPLLDANTNLLLSLDTKYYTANVKLIISDFATLPDGALPVNAIIVNGSLTQAQSIEQSDAFKEADIRLFYPGPAPTKEMFDWAIENQVEIIDIEEEPERIREALESSIWPGAQMKNDSNNHFLAASPVPSAPTQTRHHENIDQFEDDFADILGDDQLEMATLFNMVGRARSQGANMSDEERRQNAERVISAISKMLGDDLDLDS